MFMSYDSAIFFYQYQHAVCIFSGVQANIILIDVSPGRFAAS
jgi:hypothetical protein